MRLLRALPIRALKMSKDGDCMAYLSCLFHCLAILQIKKILLTSSLVSLYVCCPWFPHCASLQRAWLHLVNKLFTCNSNLLLVPSRGHFSSRQNKPWSLSLLSSWGKCSRPQSNWGLSLFLVQRSQNLDRVSRWDLLSAEQRGIVPPPWCPGCAPVNTAQGVAGHLCSQGTLLAHAQLVSAKAFTSLPSVCGLGAIFPVQGQPLLNIVNLKTSS